MHVFALAKKRNYRMVFVRFGNLFARALLFTRLAIQIVQYLQPLRRFGRDIWLRLCFRTLGWRVPPRRRDPEAPKDADVT